MRKGHIKKGFVKETRRQQKKHYTQFAKDELIYLENKIKDINIDNVKASKHLLSKTSTSYKHEDIINVLKDSNLKDRIIEYNVTITNKGIDRRVLLRSKEIFDVFVNDDIKKCNLCFVISILSSEIITVYYNECYDNHDTIDWRRYNADLKVVNK